MRTHASQEVACACVMAETARTSSSVAPVNASERMRMRDPLPLSRSPARPVARMLSQVASAMEVSSLQVPAGWLCEPCPAMPRARNSYGTPRASPTACP